MIKYPEISKEVIQKAISPYKKILENVNLSYYKKFFNKDQKEPKEKVEIIDNSVKLSGTIKVNTISKSFGENNILNNISLTIPKGKIFGLVGVSGSGKTTLLKLIVGFYKPTKGSVSFDGKDVLKYNKAIRKSFGFASQENCFYGRLNVEENVRYFGQLYGLIGEFIDSRMDSLLKLVGLFEARKTLAENLSTGMKRRLDIACSLIHDPNVLILDEPTEDLDPNLRKEVINMIKKINREDKTIIMTSHLLGEVENICDVVGVISNGKIVKLGSPEQLKKEYSRDFEIHLETSSRKYTQLLKGIKTDKIIKKNKSVTIYVKEPEKVLPKIMSKAKQNKDKIINLKVSRPSLSEVFQDLTKNAKK
ncbi:ABC transporter ATP-binding protein [Candidatus Woesearchaeota archaeon]|nr:ABC transporter ATP-binding protein [Candidatus Woesearchaeota archaeon]